MKAPIDILNVWHQFDSFPMERFTKLWYAQQMPPTYQRTVEQMKAHYQQYKITGNCFDLAIWLIHEFRENGIHAYAVGHDLMTDHAHVAVIAEDERGYKYLCDLGDQWIQPICVDPQHPMFHEGDCYGFFPGATIQVKPLHTEVEILYKRPNGKISRQQFLTTPISDEHLLKMAEHSQRIPVKKLLLEVRQFDSEEVTHWEFYDFKSFTSTMNGIIHDDSQLTIQDWAQKIHEKTNYSMDLLMEVLNLARK